MYARIQEGIVVELIDDYVDASGRTVPIEERYAADVAAACVVVPDGVDAALGWTYDGKVFGAPSVPLPSTEARLAALRDAVQLHMDAQAAALGYDDIKTAVTYADEPAVPKFQNEGRALRVWRSLVWEACYEVLAQWTAGQIVEPTAQDLIGLLPAFDASA